MDILTDGEKTKILQIASDPTALEALRKVFLAGIYSNGTLRKGFKADPLQNAAFSLITTTDVPPTNEELGQELKGLWYGVQSLEYGFMKLRTIAEEMTVEKPKEDINEAI